MRDQNFRAVFVVACAQRPRLVLAGDQPKAKSVARRFVFGCVILQILPKMVGQGVFVRDIRFEDGFEFRPFRRECREFKIARLPETNEKDALAVLGHDALRVNDPVINCVAENFRQGFVDDAEGVALVVALEVLHVLQHERIRLVILDDVRQREKQVALFKVFKSVFFAEAQFLGNTRDAERLAGKSGAKDVVIRDFIQNGMNIAVRSFAVIGGVGFLCLFIPV